MLRGGDLQEEGQGQGWRGIGRGGGKSTPAQAAHKRHWAGCGLRTHVSASNSRALRVFQLPAGPAPHTTCPPRHVLGHAGPNSCGPTVIHPDSNRQWLYTPGHVRVHVWEGTPGPASPRQWPCLHPTTPRRSVNTRTIQSHKHTRPRLPPGCLTHGVCSPKPSAGRCVVRKAAAAAAAEGASLGTVSALHAIMLLASCCASSCECH